MLIQRNFFHREKEDRSSGEGAETGEALQSQSGGELVFGGRGGTAHTSGGRPGSGRASQKGASR